MISITYLEAKGFTLLDCSFILWRTLYHSIHFWRAFIFLCYYSFKLELNRTIKWMKRFLVAFLLVLNFRQRVFRKFWFFFCILDGKGRICRSLGKDSTHTPYRFLIRFCFVLKNSQSIYLQCAVGSREIQW